jgi:hypothetical protein
MSTTGRIFGESIDTGVIKICLPRGSGKNTD